MASEKRSPIQGNPLRNPGQSLDDRMFGFIYDRLVAPLLMAFFLIVIAVFQWLHALNVVPPAPLLYTAIAVIAVGYAVITILRAIPEMRALKLGRDGEKAVGQYLERLRENGYTVFHDIVATGFNIDHVLIGPAGVFSIETKTFSKAPGPDVKVRFDGEVLTVDGVKLDRDPVAQARGQARWLQNLIEQSTGRKFPVRPVILFPGWFVEQKSGTSRAVWVLEPKALPAFLAREPETLSTEEIKMAGFHLSRFIRTQAGVS